MPISSSALPIFEETCAVWHRRLINDESIEASKIRVDALLLLYEVREWKMICPTPDERLKTISKVLEMHRRALEYVTRQRL